MLFDDVIVGTAGHIDHGKSSLVRAITGTDPDRLPEEKARGITLVLGFGSRTLPSGRVAAFVDVPGHEALVRTMVSGATGIDVVLLVVAADDGVMPQTREHLAICRLLGVPTCVAALSKIDIVDEDLAKLAEEDVRELLENEGYVNAAVCPVSSVTGAGIERLLEALDGVSTQRRRRLADAPLRLPVDRSFLVRGHGLVVTGTLAAGRLAVGDEVETLPRRGRGAAVGRVRALEVHGARTDSVRAGTRVAAQPTGLEKDDVAVGGWLVRAGELTETSTFDARARWLPSCRRPLPRRARLALHVGAACVPATVTLLEAERLAPGEEGLVRVVTDVPVVVRPSERGVLRSDAAVARFGATAAGIEVVRAEVEPYRARSAAAVRARRVEGQVPVVRAEAEASIAGAGGIARTALVRRMPDGDAAGVAGALGEGRLVDVGAGVLAARSAVEASVSRMSAWLARALSDERSARLGVPVAELRASAGRGAHPGVVDRALELLLARGEHTMQEGRVRAKREPQGRSRIDEIAEALHAVLVRAVLAPPRVAELPAALAGSFGAVSSRDVGAALAVLEKQQRATRVSSELWFDRGAVEALKARVIAHLEHAKELDAQTFKELTSQSRKYAIPLAEHLDQCRVTLRVGDVRRRWGS